MRRGLTLIELLVVAFILVLFVAIAAPLMRPNTETQKIREAARQVTALMEEAKTHAIQKNGKVALVFDRKVALSEDARDSNLVTQLHIVEIPGAYKGDVEHAVAGLWLEPYSQPGPSQPTIPGFTPPPVNNNPAKLIVLDFQYNGSTQNAMMDVLTASYFNNPQPGDSIPLRIRLGNDKTWYAGLARYSTTTGPTGIPGHTIQYFVYGWFGSNLYTKFLQEVPNPYPDMMKSPVMNEFAIEFPPMREPIASLTMPTGTAVDLQFSGMGLQSQFFDGTRSSAAPLGLVINQLGEVEMITSQANYAYPTGRLYFLVGSIKRAVDTIDAANPLIRDPVNSNLGDTEAFWVSLSTRTGAVGTAENSSFTLPNLPSSDPNYWPNILQQARHYAINSQVAGGR